QDPQNSSRLPIPRLTCENWPEMSSPGWRASMIKPFVSLNSPTTGARRTPYLADSIASIRQAAVGFDLKFRLRLELSGASRPPDDMVAKINLLLQDISEQLRLR